MTKSRRAMGLLLLGWATAGAAAGPVSADQAMARYREAFQPVEARRCPRGARPDDIVVCGRRDGPDPNRVPFPDAHEPGDRVHLLPGEAPSATEALARTDRSACEAAGPNHSCGGSISLLSILFGLIYVAKAAHDRHAD